MPNSAPSLTPDIACQHVTLLLDQATAGDRHAAAELLPLVYNELRRLAQANMGREGSANVQTLQPTALVHEAYLRLLGPAHADAAKWDSRGHFFAAAATAMRRILIDRARAKCSDKRGGGAPKAELTDDAVASEPDAQGKGEEILALDEALSRLEVLDARASQVVLLRYFGGLTVEQTAAAMGVSPATVKKSWTFARAWLNHQIRVAGASGR
jgi:hypothetical protein